MVTYPSLCSTCVTYRILCHAICHQVLPTKPLSREAEDFARDGNHFKFVPPLTYLVNCKQFVIHLNSIFMHVNIAKFFTCGEKFDKKYRSTAKLISNHKFWINYSLKKYISEHKFRILNWEKELCISSSKLHMQELEFYFCLQFRYTKL